MGAEPHGGVDGVDRAHALIEGVNRLVDHRQQDTVDHEGRKVLRYGEVLPSVSTKFLVRLEGGVLGGDAADHLDQLHHRRRVHEMEAR